MPSLSDILSSIQRHPRYVVMRGAARFSSVRHSVGWGRRWIHRGRLKDLLAQCGARAQQSPFQSVDTRQFVLRLREDGLAMGLQLPQAIVQEIRAFAATTPCYADRDAAHGFHVADHRAAQQALGKPVLLAQYFNTESDCPAIAALVRDPVLLSIAAQYLESTPTFVGANLWWTFPVNALAADRDRHAHLFHRDVDDFRFFKFFFYLTDVQPADGAHVCVAGSHRRPPLLRLGDRWNIRRYSDQEVASCFARERISEIHGPAGTGFAENTMCVHKGLTPTREPRLLLQLQYALFDYGVMHDRRPASALRMLA
jgi:hypothetical protein